MLETGIPQTKENVKKFESAFEHLQAELGRLDLLLHREILRLRARYQLSLDEFRGLYVSDQQVDALINQSSHVDAAVPGIEQLNGKAEGIRLDNEARFSPELPWSKVVEKFGLSRFEQDVLLLAIAPEIDLKYEVLYAYLNNDVTRKWPTVDLALRLFAEDQSARTSLRSYLQPGSRLFLAGLIRSPQTPQKQTHGLTSALEVSPMVQRYILEQSWIEAFQGNLVERISNAVSWEDMSVPGYLNKLLRKVPKLFTARAGRGEAPVLIFEGVYGSGRKQAAQAITGELGIELLCLDWHSLINQEPLQQQMLLRDIVLYSHLTGAGALLSLPERRTAAQDGVVPSSLTLELKRFIHQMNDLGQPVFISCHEGFAWRDLFTGCRTVSLQFAEPEYSERLRYWESSVRHYGYKLGKDQLQALADRFVLTRGQIREAVASAADAGILLSRNGKASVKEDAQHLFDAARMQCGRDLGELAQKIDPHHTWDSLVLPPAALRQVKEVAAAVHNRHQVYYSWGFEQSMASGKGLKVLFSGPSGTGKTMTASVLAADLGLDLYKIDLSGVVSKYIGETEKNLDRIFNAAKNSNSILFFDEADALFGKRTEVKDSHDRYANIEISFLLQKMEDHEGVVILATNLGRNIDEAFSRRMHYIVDFPLPPENHRYALWQRIIPPQAPLAEDVDLKFFAKQFKLTGGDIRNIVLNAAFLAAEQGSPITMELLVKSVAQQMTKRGSVPTPAEFRNYYPLISANGK